MTAGGCSAHPTYRAGCAHCRALGRRYDRRRDTAIRNGTWQCVVPAIRVVEHLEALRVAGMSMAAVAAAARVPVNTIYSGRANGRQHFTGPIAQAILAVTATPGYPSGMRSALGAMRRVRALVAIGYTLSEQARRAGKISRQFIFLASGKQNGITDRFHQKVCDLFEELSATPGTSARARTMAARSGWLPPLAWDDLDDPNDQPSVFARGQRCVNNHEYDRDNNRYINPATGRYGCRSCIELSRQRYEERQGLR